MDPRVGVFWDDFLRARPGATLFEAFRFGDNDLMADELADLVRAGVKSATSSLLWEYETSGKRHVDVGDLSIVLTASRAPVCVIETTEVRVRSFDQVDAQFARDYGEGDRTLEWWRAHLWQYYTRQCVRLNREPRLDMPLVCERFRVVFPESVAPSRDQ